MSKTICGLSQNNDTKKPVKCVRSTCSVSSEVDRGCSNSKRVFVVMVRKLTSSEYTNHTMTQTILILTEAPIQVVSDISETSSRLTFLETKEDVNEMKLGTLQGAVPLVDVDRLQKRHSLSFAKLNFF